MLPLTIFRRSISAAFLIGALTLSSLGQAAILYWDGTDTDGNANGGHGIWNTATANWDTLATGGANAVWNNATPDSAVFGGAAGTVTLGDSLAVSGITFNTSGYVVAQDGGNLHSLTIGTGGVNLTTGVAATINAKLTGNHAWQAFRSSGNGTLTLGGSVANDATGTITTSLPGHLILAKTGGVAATAGDLILNNNPVHLELGDQSVGGTTTFLTTTNSRLHTQGNTYTTRGLISAANIGVIENHSPGFGTVTGDGSGTIRIITQSGDSFTYSSHFRNVETVPAGLPGTMSLIKDGLGTQTLSGANITYTGATAVNGGTLALSGATGYASSTTTVGASGTLELNSTNMAVDNWRINTILAGSGTINKTGTGWIQTNTNAHTFSGTFNVQAGTFGASFLNSNWTGVTADFNVSSGALLDVRGQAITIGGLNDGTGAGAVGTTWTTAATLNLGAANKSGTFSGSIQGNASSGANNTNNPNGGVLSLNKIGTGTQTLSGTLSYTGNTTVNNGALTIGGTATLGSSTIFVAPPTSGSATLNVVSGATLNAGHLSLFQNNVNNNTATYNQSGGTVNLSGIFQPGASSLGGSSGNANIANFTGGTFTASTIHLYKWATTTLNLRGSAVVNTTALDLGWVDSSPTGTINLGDGSTFSGGTNIHNGGTSGVLNVGAFVLRSNRNYTLNFKGGTLKASAGGGSWLQAGQFTTASVQDAGGIIDNGGNAITIAQVLSHGGVAAIDGGLEFKGAGGTTTLTGNNTYTGQTSVLSGTLALSHASNNNLASSTRLHVASGAILNTTGLSGSADLVLANGQTLQGSGSIVGNVTVSNGATLSPGSSPGTITFANNLTISPGATYAFEDGDLTNVLGALALGDSTLTNWTLELGKGFLDGGSIVLFEYGTLAANFDLTPTFDLSNMNFVPSGSLSLINDTANQRILLSGIHTSIPEPSTFALLACAVLGAAGYRLRRRRLQCREVAARRGH